MTSFMRKPRSCQIASTTASGLSRPFLPSQWTGSRFGSWLGKVSRVTVRVLGHGVVYWAPAWRPSMYRMYASEWSTRWGRGGTVTKRGSAGGAGTTEGEEIEECYYEGNW
uniref:(northern house mosquito) hypothetical protein n=1 Tax=Culex pipiens TaxID=7175 RepID=A0A8D8G1S7_CULPI